MPDAEYSSSPTRIAILGTGIAGSIAGIALNKLPNVHITLFDQATALREVGASIGLQPCAMRVLDYLGLSPEIENIGYRHEGDTYHDHTFRLWSTNEVLPTNLYYDLPNERKYQMSRFSRVALHNLLVSKLPGGSVNLSKRVKSVKTVEEGDVVVEFQDGSKWNGDLVIGADGIKSATRQSFYPEYKLLPGRGVALREVFPISLLEGVPDLPKESVHYVGPDVGFFYSPLKGDQVAVVGHIPLHRLPPDQQDTLSHDWAEKGNLDSLKAMYSDWCPTIAQIARRTPAIRVYPDWNGPALPTHILGDGRVVLIGDAGHCHGGYYAAGGTMSCEDAYTLYLALKHAQDQSGGGLDKEAIKWALKTYDKARHGHTTRVIDEANKARAKALADHGKRIPDEELKRRVANRPNLSWLAENDTVGVFERVIKEHPFVEA